MEVVFLLAPFYKVSFSVNNWPRLFVYWISVNGIDKFTNFLHLILVFIISYHLWFCKMLSSKRYTIVIIKTGDLHFFLFRKFWDRFILSAHNIYLRVYFVFQFILYYGHFFMFWTKLLYRSLKEIKIFFFNFVVKSQMHQSKINHRM